MLNNRTLQRGLPRVGAAGHPGEDVNRNGEEGSLRHTTRSFVNALAKPRLVPNTRRKRNIIWAIYGLAAGVLGSLVLLMLAVIVPQLFGMQSMVVLSGSMEPTLHVGDIAVVRKVDPYSLKLGDVITYATGGKLITHRIVGINMTASGPTFTMEGDANNTTDPAPVKTSQVRGKVAYRIPRLGYLVSFASSPLGAGVMILLPALVLIYLTVQQRFANRGRSAGEASTAPEAIAVSDSEVREPRSRGWVGYSATPEQLASMSPVARRLAAAFAARDAERGNGPEDAATSAEAPVSGPTARFQAAVRPQHNPAERLAAAIRGGSDIHVTTHRAPLTNDRTPIARATSRAEAPSNYRRPAPERSSAHRSGFDRPATSGPSGNELQATLSRSFSLVEDMLRKLDDMK